ncbi:hypothetical protein IT396_01860 [Candidatus Nomurabacteria bacterium]|nr:hypothetical protein [Candidatus Nomurabacteria bacterium]
MNISFKARAAHFLLRAGAAFAFAYPAINAWGDPESWIGYFPPFVLGLGQAVGLSDFTILHLFGALEIGIALWFLWGKHIFWPSVLATVLLVAIVLFNMPQMQVLFRDLSIAALTLALALTHLPHRTQAVQ